MDSLFPSATPWLPPSPSGEGQPLRGRADFAAAGAEEKRGVNALPYRGYNPSVFSACKTSRKASSPSIRSKAPSFIVARVAKPPVFGETPNTKCFRGKTAQISCLRYTGEPRTALRQRTARLHRSAHRGRALSLPQSFCAAKRRKNPAPSSEGAENRPPFTHSNADNNPLSHGALIPVRRDSSP